MKLSLMSASERSADMRLRMESVLTVSSRAESESPILSNSLSERRNVDRKAAVPLGRVSVVRQLAMHVDSDFG